MNLEERSFRNMIWFFTPQLKRIQRGERATRFLTICARRTLKQKGVLVCMQGGGNRLTVSKEARKIMEEEARAQAGVLP